LAAELDELFSEETDLIKSSGGVFEVEDTGQLIFSKSTSGRFPDDHEVAKIIQLTTNGSSLVEAQREAAQSAQGVSFGDWLKSFLHRNQTRNT